MGLLNPSSLAALIPPNYMCEAAHYARCSLCAGEGTTSQRCVRGDKSHQALGKNSAGSRPQSGLRQAAAGSSGPFPSRSGTEDTVSEGAGGWGPYVSSQPFSGANLLLPACCGQQWAVWKWPPCLCWTHSPRRPNLHKLASSPSHSTPASMAAHKLFFFTPSLDGECH